MPNAMRLPVVLVLLSLTACQAKVGAKAKVATDAPEESQATAWGSTETAGTSGEATTSAPNASVPMTLGNVQTTSAPLACPLVCVEPHHGRIAQADEARLSSGLADTMQELRSCVRRTRAVTLRFDGTSALTHFGVDADDVNEPMCLTAIRDRRPALAMPGPITVRCSERCERPGTEGRPRARGRGRGRAPAPAPTAQ